LTFSFSLDDEEQEFVDSFGVTGVSLSGGG
jgi:hypothetical protein